MITPRQHHVLSVLVTRGSSACNEWDAWDPLDTKQVYGIMHRLEQKRYVEVEKMTPVPRHGPVRVYAITEKGLAALKEWDEEHDS